MITILENYITEQQERDILSILPNINQDRDSGRNRVFRWGSKKAYNKDIISKDIPYVFKQFNFKFDSVTINEYLPGQFLDWHTDNAKSGEKIIILSLLGSATMKLRSLKEEISYQIPPRSLTIMEGEHRWSWEHYVSVEEKRYSVVFRNTHA